MGSVIILDLVVVVLLLATIVYSFILNSKINKLHNSKKEFINIIKHFDQTVTKTEANITEIRRMTVSVNKEIDVKIEHAKILLDDIDYVSEKGKNVVNAIQSAIANTKENIAKASREQQMDMATTKEYVRSYGDERKTSTEEVHNIIPMKKKEKKKEQAQVLEDLMRRIAESRSKNDTQGLEDIENDIINKFQIDKKQQLHEN